MFFNKEVNKVIDKKEMENLILDELMPLINEL